MSGHLMPWLARLSCTHATPTSVAATVGNWVSCGVCHDQKLIRSVSRVALLELSNAIPPAYTEFIGGQLLEYIASEAAA